MGRLRMVTLVLSFILLHGVQAGYDDNNFEEDDYVGYDNEEEYEEPEYDYEEEGADFGTSSTTETVTEVRGTPPQSGPLVHGMGKSGCKEEGCEIEVVWGPPEGDECLRGYRVGFRQLSSEEWTWIEKLEGTHKDLATNKHFFLEEAEGTVHVQMITNLPYQTTYQVVIEVFNPFGSIMGTIREVTTLSEPCRDATVSDPVKFVESTETSLTIHLAEWKDANCITDTFIIEHREGDEGYRTIPEPTLPGDEIAIANLKSASWNSIRVRGVFPSTEDYPTTDTTLEFEIATLAEDGSGFPGCVIEKDVKYWGNTFASKQGINQETCALLCFRKPACTHWTYNPTYQGGKCWMKTSDSGRTKSTTGSSSGPKACGRRGFSLPDTRTAVAGMGDCNPPWTSLDTGCYLLQEWNSSWYESKRQCRQSGGYLVEVDSQEEQDAILGEINARGWDGDTHFGFWIGLTDIFHDGGTWVWDNLGKPLDFSYWASGEPNNWRGIQHCAVMKLGGDFGKWDDLACDKIKSGNFSDGDTSISYICEAEGSSMTYTKESGKKWENENGKTSHMKVVMVHDEEECEKECTATVPCIAFTFISGMEICALKAPKDAVTLVTAGGGMISGSLDGERPGVEGKALDEPICLSCLPACNVEEGTKYAGHNLFPLGAETQEECAAACLGEPECNFWTHNPNIGRCWLKKSDLGRTASTKGSNSGQKSCGVTEEDIRTGHVLESGCTCNSGCLIEQQIDYRGRDIGSRPHRAETLEECAKLSFATAGASHWTFLPNRKDCWLKTSDAGRTSMSEAVVSGNRECGIEYCGVEENTKYSGHNLYTTKGIKVGNMAGCADLCFKDSKCKFWTYNPRVSKCWMKTSDEGKSPSDKGSVSGQKACGAPGVLPEEPESLPTSGVMTSPSYPSNYPNNLHQRKTIQVAKGNIVNIHFTDFELEHYTVDFLEITDGDGTSLGHFTQQNDHLTLKNITSRTETVDLLFHTDDSVTRRGWSLEWSADVPREEAPPTSGALISHIGYPHQNYPNDARITDTITVPRGNIIIMQFTEFAVEDDRYDYVVITDGQNSYDNRDDTMLAKFDGYSPRLGGWDLDEDGRKHPRGWANRITSSTETVTVTFITDGSVTRKGWRLEWSMLSFPEEGGEKDVEKPIEESQSSIPEPQPGVLISGGWPGSPHGYIRTAAEGLSSIETFLESGKPNCSIPDLPLGRIHHTMSVLNKNTLVVCGGLYTTHTCISWSKDSPDNVWEFFASLSTPRRRGVSYSSTERILIMGGQDEGASQTGVVLEVRERRKRCNGEDNSCCTADNPCMEGDGDCDSDDHCSGSLVCGNDNCFGHGFDGSDDCCTAPGKTSYSYAEITARGERVFTLHHYANRACLIPGEDFFIITGGLGPNDREQAYVDRYFLNGDFDSELPSLNTVRLDHACSSYYDHNDQLVLLVTSGTDDLANWQYSYLDTTELLLPGASEWTSVTRLPKKLQDARAINAGGKIYLTGGADDNNLPSRDEIYRFDERKQVWDLVHRLEKGRGSHDLVAVDFSQLCE